MRVITGTARGRRLKELQGTETRPTTDRVKESIFNIIQFHIEGRRVLDLFGGTGQLGIEALSRGAAFAVFVDNRTAAVRLIRENLEHCGLAEKARVVQGDALAFLAGDCGKFDLVFLDPPYGSGLLGKAVSKATAFDILSENGIMICESRVEEVLPEFEAPYTKLKEYRYGAIKLTLYRREANNSAGGGIAFRRTE